ncbi:hypothetical protein [Xanthomonas sp. SHU 199]|uniref:hypothetical protein n=1 Tax=Xanthomonas sp. SHU 199 TaxID=1591174 RepID=UPI00037B76C7|nr:hypothetical protein [Xanthomonas sp. SHU 199]
MTQRLEEVADRLSTQVSALREAVNKQSGSSNGNVVRIEGMGTMWHGLAIGIAISGVLAGMVWIGWVASDARVSVRQAEAYRAAVYVVAPKFSEKIDEELERNKERQKE